MPIFPQKVLSNTPQAIDHNRGVEALRSVRGGRAPGTLMRSGPLGTSYQAAAGVAGEDAPPASGLITRMVIHGIGDDYLTCRMVLGSGQDSTDIFVAKVEEFRGSLTVEHVDAQGYTYAWSDANTRTSYDGTAYKTQKVTPRWLVFGSYSGLPTEPSSFLWALQSANGTGVIVSSVECTWVEVMVGRGWSEQ